MLCLRTATDTFTILPQMVQAGVQQRALILAMVDLEILLYLANTVTNQTNGAGQSHC